MSHHHVSVEQMSNKIFPFRLTSTWAEAVSMPNLPFLSSVRRRKRLKGKIKHSFLQAAEMLRRQHNLGWHYRDSNSENLCSTTEWSPGKGKERKKKKRFFFPLHWTLKENSLSDFLGKWFRLYIAGSKMFPSTRHLTWLFSPWSWYFSMGSCLLD